MDLGNPPLFTHGDGSAAPAPDDAGDATGLDSGAESTTPALTLSGRGPRRRRGVNAPAPAPVQRPAAFVAAQRDPEQWAKVLELTKRLNLPDPAFVARNYEELAKKDARATLSHEMDGVSPSLRAWLSDPDNATLAKHETAPLARVDAGAQAIAPSADVGGGFVDDIGTATATGAAQLVAAHNSTLGHLAAAYGLASPRSAAEFIANANQRVAALQAQAPDYVKAFDAARAQHSNDLDAAWRTFLEDAHSIRTKGMQGALATIAEGGHTASEALGLLGTFVKHPGAAAYQGAEGLALMVPMIGGAAAGGVIGAAAGPTIGGTVGSLLGPAGTVGGVYLGGLVGGTAGAMAGTAAGTAPGAIGEEMNAELTKRGIDITDPHAIEAALRDPLLMRVIRAKATAAGLSNAAVVGLVSGLAGKLLGRAEAAGASLPVKVAAASGDVGVQAAGMAGAQAVSKTVAGDEVRPSDLLNTAASMLLVGGAMEGVAHSRRAFYHADPVVAAEEVHGHAMDALETLGRADALTEIGRAVKEAPTTSSAPDRLRALVETASGGEDAAHVYFDKTAWDDHWTAQGVSPAEAAARVMGDEGQAYHDAESTGARLAIALPDFVQHLGAGEHYEALLQSARTRPDGMTLGEAQDYLQSLPATLHAIATEASSQEPAAPKTRDELVAERAQLEEQITAAPDAPESVSLKQKVAAVDASLRKNSAELIRQRTEEQLLAAGRSTTEAKAGALELSSMFHALGDRAGLDPAELYSRYRLEIGAGDAPAGVAETSLQQSADDSVRGRIRFGQDGQTAIDLFKAADRSTFFHETGHFGYRLLEDLAGVPEAPAQIVADHTTLREFVGAEEGTPLSREQQEQIADAFETYLMKGEAPSVGLRKVFFHLREWLTRIYKGLAPNGVELSPDVRAVFDRLLATDAEIEEAEKAQHATPLFPDPRAVGMNEETAARYAAAVEEAHQASVEQLSTKMMGEVLREQSAEWKAWRDPMRAEIAAEVNARPVYRAMEYLRKGTQPDGSPLPDGTAQVKLNREAVIATHGKETAAKLGGLLASPEKGGVNPSLVADLFGFPSGRALVDALAAADPREQLIDFVTDQRMQLEHGERPTRAEVKEAAIEAVRGGAKGALQMKYELEHLVSEDFATFKGLVKRITRPIPPDALIHEQAARSIATRTVRELRPDLLEVAARRHAQDATDKLLRGDVEGAFDAKTRERLATAVYRAALEAKAEVQATIDLAKKAFRPDEKLAKTRDLDYVNAARSVLATFGIGESTATPDSFLAQVREYDPESAENIQGLIDEALTGNRGVASYKDLSIDQFRALTTSVRGIWDLSRSSLQIEVDGVKRNRHEVRAELVGRAESLAGTGELPGVHKAITKWERAKLGLLSLKAASTKIEHWVRAMDGGVADGVFRRYLWNRISEAATDYRVEKAATVAAYAEHAKALQEGEGFPITRDVIDAPELGYQFHGHNELLGALLHAGNESNLQKLLVGRGWAEEREDGTIDASRWESFLQRMRDEGTLTKAHYDWAQDVWDRLESLKPEAQRAHKRMFGRYFDEVTRRPFANEFGAYDGGYYPAKADRDIVPDADRRADRDALLGGNNSFMFPSVAKGFTIKRVEGYRRPLVMDASAVPQHIDAVLKFTHLGPAVREVARVVMDPLFRDAIDRVDPAVIGDALVPWLQRAGQQRAELPQEGGKFWQYASSTARTIRNNAALQIMTANTTVLLEQLTHFPSVFVRVAPSRLASALWQFATSPRQTTADIHGLSDFMATRESAGLMEARKALDKILLDPTVFETGSAFVQEHARFLMTMIQSTMDHSVWQATFDHAIETMSPDDAVRHADATVRELLGTYSPEDVSRIEAGTPIQKLFTMFLGFFNTKANVLGAEFSIAQQAGLSKSKARIASASLWGFAVPAMIGLMIKNSVGGKGALAEEDDEGALHALLRLFGQSTFEMGARMIPYGGSALTVVEHSFHAGRQDDLLNSPALKMTGDALRAPAELTKALHDGALTRKSITDVFTLLGMATGLPMRPIGKGAAALLTPDSGRH